MHNNHVGRVKAIIVSFLMTDYPLKNPNNECLSYLDNSLKLEANMWLFFGWSFGA